MIDWPQNGLGWDESGEITISPFLLWLKHQCYYYLKIYKRNIEWSTLTKVSKFYAKGGNLGLRGLSSGRHLSATPLTSDRYSFPSSGPLHSTKKKSCLFILLFIYFPLEIFGFHKFFDSEYCIVASINNSNMRVEEGCCMKYQNKFLKKRFPRCT